MDTLSLVKLLDLTQQACKLLRKQKFHKKKTEQQQQMLDNLEQILSRIQQAETDAMVSTYDMHFSSVICTYLWYTCITVHTLHG